MWLAQVNDFRTFLGRLVLAVPRLEVPDNLQETPALQPRKSPAHLNMSGPQPRLVSFQP